MTDWEINSIEALPDISCVSSVGKAIVSGRDITLWSPTQDYTDCTTGSITPATFRISQAGVTDYSIQLDLYGTCDFPAKWVGKKYVIRALIDDPLVFQSKELIFPKAGPKNVVVDRMLWQMKSPADCQVPFRFGADFTWARSAAPSGPALPSPGSSSRVNLSPGYPIGLFRIFSPTPMELLNAAGNPVDWYIERSMNLIWNPGSIKPKYDTMYGSSYYNMGRLGGSLNLDWWIKKHFPLCNCYDLAAITQLCCAILVDNNGNEVLNSHWVFQFPSSYINPGPLYGWVPYGGSQLDCNSPFWMPQGTPPYVAPNDASRTDFGNHAWVEIMKTGGAAPMILDATHALKANNPVPEIGTHTRLNYLNLTLDQTKSKSDPSPCINGIGACWISPDTQLYHIGVIDATGEPDYNLQMNTLPKSLKADIEEILECRKPSPYPDNVFNSVSVHPQTLIPKLFVQLDFLHEITEIVIKPTVTQVLIKAKPTFEQSIEEVISTFTVFDSLEDPISALTSYLLGFQVTPLRSIIKEY